MLFHVTPEQLHLEPSDEELGVLDTVWLGLMPTTIAQLIYKNIREISRKFDDKEEGTMWRECLMQDWKEIENFNMGRAIGIHRIMNGVGTDYEAELISKHGLHRKQKDDKAKKISRAKRSIAHLQKESNECQTKKSKKTINKETVQKTTCNGITCGLEKVRWCGTSTFCPNSIPINRKQCLRCSMFTTAMKTTVDMLIHLQRIPSHKQVKMIQLLQVQKQKRNINFNSLIHMLKTLIPSNEQFQRAQYINKKRPTEKWKRICKLLIVLATRNINPTHNINNAGPAIEKWINEMEQTIKMKDKELKHNKIFMDKCFKEFECEMKLIKAETKTGNAGNEQKSISPQRHIVETTNKPTLTLDPKPNSASPSPLSMIINISSDEETSSNQCIESRLNGEEGIQKCTIAKEVSSDTERAISNIEKEALLRAKINLLSRRTYTAGSTMLMAIEVIRDTYREGATYVACPEAAQIISSWNPSEGWCRFARIFYSNLVCNRKPDGLYIIPIFSGETTAGHWSVIAIQKIRRKLTAVILDSLGRGSLNTPTVNLISQAFTPSRGRMEWKNPVCRSQNEAECGARTICAMSSLAKAFHEEVNFDESIRLATLWTPAEYDQVAIRRSAANLVQKYRNHMKSRAIRLRQWR